MKKNDIIKAILDRDPAARTALEVRLLYPGYKAVRNHRLAHWLYNKKLLFLARWVADISRFFTLIEIHPGAKIGKGLFIDHGCGLVIGETAEIGDNVTIYQGVTLGGTGKEHGKRHPTIGDNAVIGAGARVLGPFRVGKGAKIAAGAVVLDEVPDDATAVGVPARVVRVAGRKVALDHVHIPDPVAQELCKMRVHIERLEKRVRELEGGHENI
ncbi:MAG: serine O-acetyltransferase [Oscillospiraceae bacterium]|nr:serine O-acetyltransferase [Oscillospiraceae bacterium]